jgi:F-type H+-transporting ATPase subunit b
MGLFEALGLDIRILLAQFINFAVLIFVLYRFLYTPLFSMMEKRKKTIEEGIRRAKEADQILEKAEKEAETIVLEARREAKGIIADAHATAKQSGETELSRVKEQATEIMNRAKKESENERQETIVKLKSQIADLVVSATQKVVEEKLDAEKDKAFIEETILQINSKTGKTGKQ